MTDKILELEQEIEDLQLQLSTAIEHGDSVDEQLLKMNEQLKSEISERQKAERTLQKLTNIIRQEKDDLEILVEAVTDHSDRLDEQWLTQYEKMQSQALTDSLTMIPNRRYFNQHLTHEWFYATRKQQEIALIMIDIDHFKQFNDTYGHLGGDECLKKVAQALLIACHRKNDFVARYGGEEFAVIINHTDVDGVQKVAKKILKEIENLNIEHKTSLTSDYLTVSLGAAITIPKQGVEETEFISRADHLLYGAKRNGRNRYEIDYITM
ncbi:MAG: diguanylate cyclase [Gammaproteobacteria bacterium]|nr:diguanylate cyclase [Gammaproteobacteria bacterium]